MPAEPKKVTRKTLAKYAGLLGRNSLAAACLRDYDEAIAARTKVEIHQINSGFRLVLPGKTGVDGATLSRRYG